MKPNHCRHLALKSAVSLLLIMPLWAQASLYELSWQGKWGNGKVVYDAAVADSNADPLQGEYFASIVSYDVTGWEMMSATRFLGTGGSILVQARTPEETLVDPESSCSQPVCSGTSLTFQLGSAAPPFDPASWYLLVSIPWAGSRSGDGLLVEDFIGNGDERAPGAFLDTNVPTGHSLGTMNMISNARITQLEAPVPEPAEWAMVSLGLAMLAVWGRRKSQRGTKVADAESPVVAA